MGLYVLVHSSAATRYDEKVTLLGQDRRVAPSHSALENPRAHTATVEIRRLQNMLSIRDQENLAARRQEGADLKQGSRQLQPKTPGQRYPKTPIKIPLNDENATHALAGAKNILNGRSKGVENTIAPSNKFDKSSYMTPMQPRGRAVLGDKTTNAKTRGVPAGNDKSTIRQVDKSAGRTPGTLRLKAKQPQGEVRKMQVLVRGPTPIGGDAVEYCPPRPKDLPYESDIIPEGGLTFGGLKKENQFKNYYQHYFNPVDESGLSLAARQLEEKNREALEECDRRVLQDLAEFEWSVDLPDAEQKKGKQHAPTEHPAKGRIQKTDGMGRKPLSTMAFRAAAATMPLDDGTKSMQRKASKVLPEMVPKKRTGLVLPIFKGASKTVSSAIPRKTSMEMRAVEANSRSTIGHNKGRSLASALSKGTMAAKSITAPTAEPARFEAREFAGLPGSVTVASSESDKTITPSLYASREAIAATEDRLWKERVPFLSIFDPDKDDDDALGVEGCDQQSPLDDGDDDFQMEPPK